MKSSTNQKTKKQPLEGEGSYSATRRYNQNLKEHLEKADVEKLARSARRAVEGPEGPALRRAEQAGKRPARATSRAAKPERGKARGAARRAG